MHELRRREILYIIQIQLRHRRHLRHHRNLMFIIMPLLAGLRRQNPRRLPPAAAAPLGGGVGGEEKRAHVGGGDGGIHPLHREQDVHVAHLEVFVGVERRKPPANA
ncbi:hypothetical protein TorRG33x02_315020 [Trema orientale]|uniref:Uncharacterized protein n=1 Tax=Trema orientale TaxID=63057 RepID=A0A2P5BN92_TREOI|nr:hypothetical protein TorRG33x02_315020 [Trema orientale]